MVVPFVPRIENPKETQIFTLDNKMEKILNDKKLPVDSKVKLYNQTLENYNQSLNNYNLSNDVKQLTVTNLLSDKIVKQIDDKIGSKINAIEPIISQQITSLKPNIRKYKVLLCM